MIQYAIITEFENLPPKGLLKFFSGKLKKNTYNIMFSTMNKTLYEYITLPPNNQSILICRLPLSKESLVTLSDAVLTKVLNKTCAHLSEMNVDTVFIVPSLRQNSMIKKHFDDLGYHTFNGLPVLDFFVPEIIRRLCKSQNIDYGMLHAGVYENKISERGINMVMALSDYLKYITIFTRDLTMAEGIANRVYEYTGLSVYVTDDLNFSKHTLLLALDNIADKEVKIGHKTTVLDLSESRKSINPMITFHFSGDYKFLHQILGESIAPDCLEFIIHAILGKDAYHPKAFAALYASDCFSIRSVNNVTLSAVRAHFG